MDKPCTQDHVLSKLTFNCQSIPQRSMHEMFLDDYDEHKEFHCIVSGSDDHVSNQGCTLP